VAGGRWSVAGDRVGYLKIFHKRRVTDPLPQTRFTL
jgi:hypothetical protein